MRMNIKHVINQMISQYINCIHSSNETARKNKLRKGDCLPINGPVRLVIEGTQTLPYSHQAWFKTNV